MVKGSYMFAIMVAKENAILALCAAGQYQTSACLYTTSQKNTLGINILLARAAIHDKVFATTYIQI